MANPSRGAISCERGTRRRCRRWTWTTFRPFATWAASLRIPRRRRPWCERGCAAAMRDYTVCYAAARRTELASLKGTRTTIAYSRTATRL